MSEQYQEIKPNSHHIKMTARDYWRETRRQWKLTLPGYLLPGIGSVLVFYVPALILSQLLAKLEAGDVSTFTMIYFIAGFGGAWFLGEIMWRVAIYFLIRVEVDGVRKLFTDGLSKLLKKDMAFFSDNFAGSLTKKTLAYARNFEYVTDIMSFNVISNIPPLLFISYILWSVSPWVVLALYVIFIGLIALIVPLIRRRQALVEKRERASNLVSGLTADIFTNIATIKGFAKEKEELKTYAEYTKKYADAAQDSWDYQNQRIDMIISPIFVLINVVGLVLALWFSRQGVASVDSVFLTFTYFATFSRNMWEFNNIYRRLETHLSDAAQYSYLVEYQPSVTDPKKPEKCRIKKGKINFENVIFSYQKGGKVFDGFELAIPDGQKIGLVGPSGGGKTTFTKLLLRLESIEGGTITIDGQDVSKITQRDLRSNIAYVPQEPILFHRSVMENIRYSNSVATDEEVVQAAKLAFADEFICELPEGYDTLVGERGMKLSGGQKQRVAIARAMLMKAPILLLDEATSALDSKSEKLIAEALENLMKNRTTIVIAHRLSTIKKLDRIVVIKEGQIVEDGNHESLLQSKGLYSDLWSHQSGDFLDE